MAILIVAALEARRRHGRVPTVPEVFRELVRIGGACVAAFLAITVVCGLGLGWLGALGVPGASCDRSCLRSPSWGWASSTC